MATFGNTAIEIDAFLNMVLDRTYLYKATLPVDGILTNITAHTEWETAPQSIKGVIYSDSSGEPGSLLGVTPAVAATANTIHLTTTFSSPISLNAGDYWLGFVSSGTSIYAVRSATTGGQSRTIIATGSYDSPPATWDTVGDSASTQMVEIFGTYTPNIPTAWLIA